MVKTGSKVARFRGLATVLATLVSLYNVYIWFRCKWLRTPQFTNLNVITNITQWSDGIKGRRQHILLFHFCCYSQFPEVSSIIYSYIIGWHFQLHKLLLLQSSMTCYPLNVRNIGATLYWRQRPSRYYLRMIHSHCQQRVRVATTILKSSRNIICQHVQARGLEISFSQFLVFQNSVFICVHAVHICTHQYANTLSPPAFNRDFKLEPFKL